MYRGRDFGVLCVCSPSTGASVSADWNGDREGTVAMSHPALAHIRHFEGVAASMAMARFDRMIGKIFMPSVALQTNAAASLDARAAP